MNGLLFDIKRFAVHDGPGIRTTVFMKGCPLSCQWCHNPESQRKEIEQAPRQIKMDGKTFVENETVGYYSSVEDLMTELRKEKIFMETSGGGVTFSGGEPLMQPDFLKEALTACHQENIHTAVDTAGYAKLSIFKEMVAVTDLFLYDLKIMDDAMHRKYCGVSNQVILENLHYLLEENIPLRIRIPMIPGLTFTEENITAIRYFLQAQKHLPQGVDLLPFHNIANHKYERFHRDNLLKEMPNLPKSDLNEVLHLFEEVGMNVSIGG